MESEKLKIFGLVTNNTNREVVTKRRRKKSQYKKISNKVRQALIEMVDFYLIKVYLKDYLLKDAANILGVNYSTAKTILRIFRLEKRIEKKNSEEENDARIIVENIKPHSRMSPSSQQESPISSTRNLTAANCTFVPSNPPQNSKFI